MALFSYAKKRRYKKYRLMRVDSGSCACRQIHLHTRANPRLSCIHFYSGCRKLLVQSRITDFYEAWSFRWNPRTGSDKNPRSVLQRQLCGRSGCSLEYSRYLLGDRFACLIFPSVLRYYLLIYRTQMFLSRAMGRYSGKKVKKWRDMGQYSDATREVC